MKPGKYFLEKSLTDNLNNAVQRTVKHPCGNDPFGAELKQAMQSFAFTLPASLQHDRITIRETIPFRREVRVTSIPAQQRAKTHPLIAEVKEGAIVLTQPIMYVVKNGDTLSEISWRLTGRKASIRNLRNWNRISGDIIRPGQALWLSDPNDGLVKEISSKLSKRELTGRNPKISLDRLSEEMIARHGGLLEGKYQVEVKLEYRDPWEEFINPTIIAQEEFKGPWNPNYSHDRNIGQEPMLFSRQVENIDHNAHDSYNFPELGNSIKSTLSYLDSFIKGGGYGFYNSEKTAHSILKGRTPDGLFTENIIDPFEMEIVFSKANHSFGLNKFKYASKPKKNHILHFEISLDFSSGVNHLINGKENITKTTKIIRRIYKDGKWLTLDTLITNKVNIIDSLYYDRIKNIPAWKGLELD